MGVSGQLHAPIPLLSGGKAPGTHWIGGWVGPNAGLEAVEKRNTLYSCIDLYSILFVINRVDRSIQEQNVRFEVMSQKIELLRTKQLRTFTQRHLHVCARWCFWGLFSLCLFRPPAGNSMYLWMLDLWCYRTRFLCDRHGNKVIPRNAVSFSPPFKIISWSECKCVQQIHVYIPAEIWTNSGMHSMLLWELYLFA
jgi:hypothetical protein